MRTIGVAALLYPRPPARDLTPLAAPYRRVASSILPRPAQDQAATLALTRRSTVKDQLKAQHPPASPVAHRGPITDALSPYHSNRKAA